MGYDLHITRATNWIENERCAIAVEEWLSVIDGDPELKPDPENGEFAAAWQPRGSGPGGWFDWYDGNIYTTNPTRAALRKMLAIAERLTALVQGDDGEVYDSPEDWTARLESDD